MSLFGIEFNLKNTVTIIVLVGAFGILYTVVVFQIPSENRDVFNIMATLILNATLPRAMANIFPDKEKPIETNKTP